MSFSAALSVLPDTEKALAQACESAQSALAHPELAVMFFSPHHHSRLQEHLPSLAAKLQAKVLIGCLGETIVGGSREVENGPAISLWLASWNSKLEIEPFQLTMADTPDGLSLLGFLDSFGDADPNSSLAICLGDPYSFAADRLFLNRLNEDHPGIRVVGGMASGMTQPQTKNLILNDAFVEQGAVGVLLRGPVRARTIVSQGCRPIGKPMVVTKCDETMITGLGGKTPLEQLRETWPELPTHDQQLFRRGPHLGIVINEYKDQFERGDFLIRNIAGLDPDNGALAVTDRVRVGQTVQFHVRDAETADQDLTLMLQRDRESQSKPPGGALLFSCNGRGTRLFPGPDHDATVIQREVGNVALAGLFAAGEMGPVGGKNFLHGFTAGVALFEE
jgi:small ligand-binding sensory domain FIST